MTTRAREVEAVLRNASRMLIDDGIPVERCVLARALVIEAASALSAMIAECEWRDIASAPKDGTHVMVYAEYWRPTCCAVTWWVRNMPTGKIGGHMNAPLVKDGWTNGNGVPFSAEPSHWMPLPPPPARELITGEVGEEKGETNE